MYPQIGLHSRQVVVLIEVKVLAVVGFSSIAALIAQRRLGESTSVLARSTERLASGLRINRAGDDAAGLAVASSLQAQARVFAQGYRNVNDAISALNIADGGLEQLSAITIRQKELAEQAANGSLSLSQRRSLNTEANALQREFNRLIQTTDFNGLRLLNGSLSQFRIQAGYGLNGSLGLGIGANLARTVGTGDFTFGPVLDDVEVGGGIGINDDSQAIRVDFNGDGIMDIVEATNDDASLSGGVQIFLGNANGTFKSAVEYDGLPQSATSISAGDLNGDGRLDLVMGSEGGSTVFLQQANGTLGAGSYVTHSGVEGDSLLSDFNGDGKLDLATAVNSRMYINFGNGDGTFKSSLQYTSSGRSLQMGDVNGDGVNDLVTESGYLLGSTSGAFGAFVSVASGGNQITLADINADGSLDIVSDKTIRLGNNDGTFAAATTYFSGGSTVANGMHQVSSADLNGDGNLDIAVLDTAGRIRTFIGNGNGTFTSGVTKNANAFSTLLVADFNADGVSDIFGGSYNDISDYLLYGNTTTSTEVAALNINTAQGARDTLTLLEAQLNRITAERGNIGAAQSRLSSALNTLSSSTENSLAAAHRITDVDVASEAAQLTRARILQQMGAAVLAQANLMPDLALRLLRG